MKLRPYQEEALAKCSALFRGNKSVLLVAPTGAGKTVIATEAMRRATQRGRKVAFVAHRRELLDQCRTHLARLGLGGVTVISVQSSVRASESFDFAIIDEAHHATAASYQGVMARSRHVLGLTATPCRLDGSALTDVFEAVEVTTTVAELIESGHLTSPQIYAPVSLDTSRAKRTHGDYIAKDVVELMKAQGVLSEIVPRYLERMGGKRRTLLYAPNVPTSRALCEELVASGVSAVHLDGRTSMQERDRVITKFREGEITCICNVMLLTEGFDVPDAECVVIARPTLSESLYLQMCGRVMRPSPDKEGSWIMDFGCCVERHGLPQAHRAWEEAARGREMVPRVVQVCDGCMALIDNYPCEHCGCSPKAGSIAGGKKPRVVEGDLVLLRDLVQVSLWNSLGGLEHIRCNKCKQKIKTVPQWGTDYLRFARCEPCDKTYYRKVRHYGASNESKMRFIQAMNKKEISRQKLPNRFKYVFGHDIPEMTNGKRTQP